MPETSPFLCAKIAQVPVNKEGQRTSTGNIRTLPAWRFVIGQVALTGTNALTGFALVRGLSKEDYAAYSFSFALVAIGVNASNMGLTSAVLGLGGRVWPDKEALRSVLNAAQRLRNRIGAFLALPFAAYCIWQFPRIGLGKAETVLLAALVLSTIWVQMQANFYAIVLQLGQVVNTLVRNDVISAILKLSGSLLALHFEWPVETIVGWIACCLWFNYWAHRKAALPLLVEHSTAAEEHLREMRSLVKTNALRTLYWSFEGQITLLLCAWFSSTERLAEVSALGRLGVLFGIFQAFVASYTLPNIAKAHTSRRILHQVLRTLKIAGALLAPLLLWAAVHPPSLIWILGPNYTELTPHLLPFMLSSAIGQLAAVVYQMCTARAWLSLNRYYVPLVLPLQIALICALDTRRIEHVILFAGLNNLFFLLFNLTMFIISWRNAAKLASAE
ncbi:MAG: hypothetical protein NZM43_04550 [Saprospiraceae bacterium]|nr:hypothetical protein [Saprospiraceae bacterium]MDW8483579.1 hypothetical protein [Saprospiraceae bacterium]